MSEQGSAPALSDHSGTLSGAMKSSRSPSFVFPPQERSSGTTTSSSVTSGRRMRPSTCTSATTTNMSIMTFPGILTRDPRLTSTRSSTKDDSLFVAERLFHSPGYSPSRLLRSARGRRSSSAPVTRSTLAAVSLFGSGCSSSLRRRCTVQTSAASAATLMAMMRERVRSPREGNRSPVLDHSLSDSVPSAVGSGATSEGPAGVAMNGSPAANTGVQPSEDPAREEPVTSEPPQETTVITGRAVPQRVRDSVADLFDIANLTTVTVETATDGAVALLLTDGPAKTEDLLCGICMSVCCSPVVTPVCGHLFCARCWSRWAAAHTSVTCPLDRMVVGNNVEVRQDARAQRQIHALRCRCPGMLPVAAQLALRRSESTDGDTEMDTSFSSAKETAKNGTGLKEKGTTGAEEEEGCTWTGCVSDAAAHLAQCPQLVTECPYHAHGCAALLPRTLMEKHLADGVEVHLTLISQSLLIVSQRCRSLAADVVELRGGEVMSGSSVSTNMEHGLHALRLRTVRDPPTLPAVPTPTTSARVLAFNASTGRASPTERYGSWATVPSTVESNQDPAMPSPRAGRRSSHTSMQTDSFSAVSASTAEFTGGIGRRRSSNAPWTSPVQSTHHDEATLRSATAMPISNGGHGNALRDVRRFTWLVTEPPTAQRPVYSAAFRSHGLYWYAGMVLAERSTSLGGMYLIPVGHDRRVDFRVTLFNADPARDVVHVVRDWHADYVGRGWGPLRFVNFATLVSDGFVAGEGCVRLGIEILSDAY